MFRSLASPWWSVCFIARSGLLPGGRVEPVGVVGEVDAAEDEREARRIPAFLAAEAVVQDLDLFRDVSVRHRARGGVRDAVDVDLDGRGEAEARLMLRLDVRVVAEDVQGVVAPLQL